MTLDDIKAKCREDGDCLLWTGSCNGSGIPKIKLDGIHYSARRETWKLARGPLKDSELVTVTCGCVRCLNPDHLKKTSKAEVSRLSNARPAVKAKRAASAAKTNRPKFGKINMEIARQIRASDRSGLDWAEELNVSPSLISNVRMNKSWREAGNPFAGLGART